MKKIIILLLATFTFVALFSQTMTTTYVNGYKIMRGEHPVINVRDIPTDAYEQGKIKIKLVSSYETQLPDMTYQAKSEGFVRTGISELDNLNAQFKFISYSPLFSMQY
jgi:hypothetical protein